MDYTLCVDPFGDRLEAARACEADVFLQTFGNSREQLADEYGPYEAASVYVAVIEPGGDAVGSARLIMPGDGTVKSLADLSQPPWSVDGARSARAAGLDLRQTWDIATLTVRESGRGGFMSGALYHGMLQTFRANQARWVVMIIDQQVRQLLDLVGLRTNPLPGTKAAPYLGSPASVPLWSDIIAAMDEQRTVNPEAHRLMTLGIGLDGIALPDPAEYTIPAHRLPTPVPVERELSYARLSGDSAPD